MNNTQFIFERQCLVNKREDTSYKNIVQRGVGQHKVYGRGAGEREGGSGSKQQKQEWTWQHNLVECVKFCI